MNVFLTGATGFIGRALVKALLRRGWAVNALVRRPESAEARFIESHGARLVRGDITDAGSLNAAMRGAELVIHNAGWFEYGLPARERARMHAINVQGAENTLRAAADLNIPRVVHVSSIVVHGKTGLEIRDETHTPQVPPASTYEATKRAAHEIALSYLRQGLPLTIASPASVIGPGDHSPNGYLSRMYVRGVGLPVMPQGSMTFVYVDDCAEGIALTAEKGCVGEEYILGAGVLTFQEVIETRKQTKGGPKFCIHPPLGIGSLMTASMEPRQRMLGLPVFVSKEVFIVSTGHWRYSGAKSQRELGAAYRDPRQAWVDTLEGERQRAAAGRSWLDAGP